MTIFLTVLFTLAAVVGLVVFAAWYFRNDIAQQQAQIEAWRRAWELSQVEYDTEQRLREATRAAMNQMLGEVRRAERDG